MSDAAMRAELYDRRSYTQIGIENHPTLPVEYVDHAEGAALIERQAQQYLGISGPEFARRYRAGGFDPCDSTVVRVAMLLPLAGPNYPDDIGRDDWEPCVGECGRAGPVPAAHPALAGYLCPECRARLRSKAGVVAGIGDDEGWP